MSVEIQTTSVEPIRQTFSNVAERLGKDKPASRYQEATYDIQPTTNFHYHPLWEPDRELYDLRRTKIVMEDWYALLDPRQYYYGAYTTTRARQQLGMEKNLKFVEQRGLLDDLSDDVREKLTLALLPLRHLEWGANTNNCYITAYGWGTALTQATMFSTMDRLGVAQYIGRIGLLLDGNTGESMVRGKQLWLEHEAWQGLRRVVEKMFVTRDFFELFVAQNLVLDGLLYPLVYERFERRMSRELGPTLSLVTDFMPEWFAEVRRWVDSVIKRTAGESPDNARLLGQWVDAWRKDVGGALQSYAVEVFGADTATAQLESVGADFQERLGNIGLGTKE